MDDLRARWSWDDCFDDVLLGAEGGMQPGGLANGFEGGVAVEYKLGGGTIDAHLEGGRRRVVL